MIGHQAGYIDITLVQLFVTKTANSYMLPTLALCTILHVQPIGLPCLHKWNRTSSNSGENERTNYQFVGSFFLFILCLLACYIFLYHRCLHVTDLVACLGDIQTSYRSFLKQLHRLRSRISQDTEVKCVFLDE